MKKITILSLALNLMIAKAQVSNDAIGAIVYADSKFSGGNLSLQIGDYQGFDKSSNDKISSIKVNAGFQVVIYSDANFKGRSQIITESQENLNNFDFNDKISSLKVQEINSKNEPYAYVYYDADFKGRYNFFGLGEFSAIWPNDRISSIKIREGYVLTLYEHGGFQGKSHVIKSDMSDLQKIGFNDKTSSLKVTMNAATKQKNLEEMAAAKQEELEEEQKELEEMALKSQPVEEVIKTLIDTITEKEKALSILKKKAYPIYQYDIRSYTIRYRGDNNYIGKGAVKYEGSLYTPVNLNNEDIADIELENDIVEVAIRGAKFIAINEPGGIPVFREIVLSEDSTPNKKKMFITYTSNGKSEFDKEDTPQPSNNIYSIEKIFDATPKPDYSRPFTGWKKELKYKERTLPMTIYSISNGLQMLSFPGSVFSTRDAKLIESAILKDVLSKKAGYFLEDLDRLKLLGDDSDMVKTELAKIESLIRKRIKIPAYQIKVDKTCTDDMGVYEFPSTKAQDAYTAALLSMNNPSQAEAAYLKRQFQRFRVIKEGKCTTTETKLNASLGNGISELKIIPEWKDVVKFYGGYSELAKNNVTKEKYESGLYNATAVISSFELLNSNQCLAHVQLSGALEINNVPKEIYKYKGTYKMEDYDLIDIYNKNIPNLIFSFEDKKYLKSNEYSKGADWADIYTRTKSDASLKSEVLKIMSSVDMMFDDIISDEEFLKIID